jgi:hypothetical protein
MEDSSNDDDDFEVETGIEMQGLISAVGDPRLREPSERNSDPPPDGGRKAWTAGECCMLPVLRLPKCINSV